VGDDIRDTVGDDILYVMVYSGRPNFGFENSAEQPTGPVVCWTKSAPSDAFPPPANNVDILETGTSTRVRITEPDAPFDDPADVTNCEAFDRTEDCRRFDQPGGE
jgi:hypothetical protein